MGKPITLKEEIALLKKDLAHLNLVEQKLDLEIRMSRTEKEIARKEAEFKRLQDPDEDIYPDCPLECVCCR